MAVYADQVIKNNGARPEPADSETKDDRSEFERFEELAKRLVAVPKHELDEERAKEQVRDS